MNRSQLKGVRAAATIFGLIAAHSIYLMLSHHEWERYTTDLGSAVVGLLLLLGVLLRHEAVAK